MLNAHEDNKYHMVRSLYGVCNARFMFLKGNFCSFISEFENEMLTNAL